MAAAGEGQSSLSLPLPPMQYVKEYTDEKFKRGLSPRPPPPIKDTYTMFGTNFSADDAIIRPLESQNLKRLYPHNYDPKKELKKLNHSIFVSFLDLLDILIKSPSSPKRQEKIDDLTLLFINMHHLINEFRPHQARETLRVMLEQQRTQRLETAERFQKHLESVQVMVKTTVQKLPEESDLDSKLVIKTEPMDTTDGQSHAQGSVTVKEEDDSEPSGCNPLDAIMCNIVDSDDFR